METIGAVARQSQQSRARRWSTWSIWLIIAGVIWGVVEWAVKKIGVPEPFNWIIRVVIVLAAALICINALLSLTGHPLIAW
jgi:hypothetical protein